MRLQRNFGGSNPRLLHRGRPARRIYFIYLLLSVKSGVEAEGATGHGIHPFPGDTGSSVVLFY